MIVDAELVTSKSLCGCNMMRFNSLILVAALVVLGCSGGKEVNSGAETPDVSTPNSRLRSKIAYLISLDQYSDAIHRINESDVESEVKQALSQDDSRWMGVFAYTLELPGLEEEAILTTPRSDIWVFPGTSDALPIEAEAWQMAATKYASKYNQILKAQLQDRP